MSELFEAFRHLDPHRAFILAVALIIAFGFEVVNGFHDTANAVTTVIYTRTLRPMPAVLFSGFCNFLGVLLGGTAIAFSIVHLLPVDLLIDATSKSAIVMVLALLTSGMAWNLSTWWLGLPVSSSHTLIGADPGHRPGQQPAERPGPARRASTGPRPARSASSLLISPLIGFVSAAILLLRSSGRSPTRSSTSHLPRMTSAPPWWIRAVLVTTCGGVSLAHGSNDGQKGMGLIMLVLIGLLPAVYALNLKEAVGGSRGPGRRRAAQGQADVVPRPPASPQAVRELDALITDARRQGRPSREVPAEERWKVRSRIFQLDRQLERRGSTGPGVGSRQIWIVPVANFARRSSTSPPGSSWAWPSAWASAPRSATSGSWSRWPRRSARRT